MIDSRLIERVKLHEGFSAAPYADTAGKLSLGYGHNIEDGPPITEATAAALLADDLVYAARLAETSLGFLSRLASDDPRRSVFVELMFNLGRRGLLSFSKMLDAAASDDWNTAADELLDSKWAVQVGPHRAGRLVAILRTGQWG